MNDNKQNKPTDETLNKFYSAYNPGKTYKADYSNPLSKRYKVYKPFQIDEETGEFLNKSKYYKFEEIEPENVDEIIQSYSDDADLPSKLKRAGIIASKIINPLQNENTNTIETIDNLMAEMDNLPNEPITNQTPIEKPKVEEPKPQEPKPQETQPQQTQEQGDKTNE